MQKEEKNRVIKNIEINSNPKRVWDVLTSPKFAKILGNEFDKNAFLESDWKLGSLVHFKYGPDKVVATGIIAEYILHSYITVDYKEINYSDNYSIIDQNGKSILTINSGPYPQDYQAQMEVWDRWLLKVKELNEGE